MRKDFLRNLIVIASLMVACVACAPLGAAQTTHLAGQVIGDLNKDSGFGGANVGAELSGALRLGKGFAVVGQVFGERAVKDFQDNGTSIGLRAAGRAYVFPFAYGEFGYEQDGQYNKTYVSVGHSYFAGGGINVKDRFQVGADYVSNDGTLAQITRARVYSDVFIGLSKHLDLKLSGEGEFRQVNADLPTKQALDPRNFGGQGLRVSVGLSLR